MKIPVWPILIVVTLIVIFLPMLFHNLKARATRLTTHNSRLTTHSSFRTLKRSIGYTLIETVIALTILVVVAVPLLSHVSRGMLLGKVRRELTGTWICEQEAVVVSEFPDEYVPVKHRYVNDDEWTIQTETVGTNPIRYTVTALMNHRQYAQIVFYGRGMYESE